VIQKIVRKIAGPLTVIATLSFLIAMPFLYTEDHPNAIFRTVIAFLCALSIGGLWTTLTWSIKHDRVAFQDAASMQLIWIFMLASNGLGAIGLYYIWFYYDLVIHFVNPLLGTEFLFFLFHYWWKEQPSFWQMIRFIFVAIAAVILWEWYEVILDALLGTSMVGQPGESNDTLTDIMAGILGVLAGVVLYNRPKWFWFSYQLNAQQPVDKNKK
jgi:hypothetical protein